MSKFKTAIRHNSKRVTVEEWKKCLEILNHNDILVAHMQTEQANVWARISTVGSSPGDAYVVDTKGTLRSDYARLILIQQRPFGTRPWLPTVSLVLDLLHEACHILLNDFDRNEDEGVAQLELVLAWAISKRLWKCVFRTQRDVYQWDSSYSKLREEKSWKMGIRRVLNRMDRISVPPFDVQNPQPFKSPWERKRK